MTKVRFHIHYRTDNGQRLDIIGNLRDGKKETKKSLSLESSDGENWTGEMTLSGESSFTYYYVIAEDGSIKTEFILPRQLDSVYAYEEISIYDYWRPLNDSRNIFQSSAFQQVLNNFPLKFSQEDDKITNGRRENSLSFRLNSPDIPGNLRVAVIGNDKILGRWEKPVNMKRTEDGIWQVDIPVSARLLNGEYKYVLTDEKNEVILWETGGNRRFVHDISSDSSIQIIRHDESFRHHSPFHKIAGMAIPVFSLRTRNGFGIGEFSDLLPAIDFCKSTGLKMLQILPVNDTIAQKTWTDSYPYAAISVFALQPLYINLDKVGAFQSKADSRRYNQLKKELNALSEIDLEKVLEHKFYFLKKLYLEDEGQFLQKTAYKQFYKDNKEWLDQYAAFCYLRDLYGSSNFNNWPAYRKYSQAKVKRLIKPSSKAFTDIAFYYFLQYHAHLQLSEAKDYGRKNQVVLKGDLPIGIYRYSSDAWVAPSLYNMEEQAGAPPDDYAEGGQNWGFPTYNWQQMKNNNYAWWRMRMEKLATYFDALRIDHILGFFRIWQIPIDQVQGTLGLFNPRLPLTTEELEKIGLTGNLFRYTEPYLPEYVLKNLFGDDLDWVKEHFLESGLNRFYSLKTEFRSQKAMKDYIESFESKGKRNLLPALYKMVGEIILIAEEKDGEILYNPRITVFNTYSYKALDEWEKRVIDKIYNQYFFDRHSEFWKAGALEKLPALLDATDILICGEDLGMIPATVPEVMDQLKIIPLEIQRMPKGNAEFGIPGRYDYLSVCSPSCHDMSTIRGWWEGNRNTALRFYREHWKKTNSFPEKCEPAIVEGVVLEHLYSPSIIAIFPIQDLLGMDEKLKRANPFDEQINNPADPQHYWRYRLHLNMEELNSESAFIEKIKSMVKISGRS